VSSILVQHMFVISEVPVYGLPNLSLCSASVSASGPFSLRMNQSKKRLSILNPAMPKLLSTLNGILF
jgi:hypothetical protein